MVLLNNVKYACETCIKGHRSSACKHTDRPLFEIKKKGRPVTQCEHCRELRKTKQVHVKCICEVKDDRRASSKSFDSAAFPNGFPETLEASVAPMSEGGGNSSDSDHSGCNCHTGGACHCCVPRKSAPSVRKKPVIAPQARRLSDNLGEKPPPNILARIAELRPVLPKLPQRDSFPDGPTHLPSIGGHPGRHHVHEDHFFSPYGRAYDHTHSMAYAATQPAGYLSETGAAPTATQSPSLDLSSYANSDQVNSTIWTPTFGDPTTYSNPLCGCGDDCRCPGCAQHSQLGSVANLTSSPCANPDTCGACFNCSILAVPLPPDTALSIYQPPEDWMQQFTSDFIDGMINSTNPSFDQSKIQDKGCVYVQSGLECSNCPPGVCICDSNNDEMIISGMAFAISGQRGTCVNGNGSLTTDLSSFNRTTPDGAGTHLIIPDPSRSRCSSTSSGSSGSSVSDQLFQVRTPPPTPFPSFTSN